MNQDAYKHTIYACMIIISSIIFHLHAITQDPLAEDIPEIVSTINKSMPDVMPYAHTLFCVYMAADNDLRSFAIRNLKQMLTAGSNENLHIVVHLDIRDSNGDKVTKRYYIGKNTYTILNEHDPDAQAMDSGDPETLISFCKMAIKKFPAKDVVLVLWDHGTGYLEPIRRGHVNPSTLFTFNPTTCKLELNRSLSYLTFLAEYIENNRGVCWDQTTQNFLSALKLDYALNTICRDCLGGKRFSIIAFDACLMAMTEIAELLSPYTDIMVASEETILGTGYDYENVLSIFHTKRPTPREFATHLVTSFFNTYQRVTQDFTLSALDLSLTPFIMENLNNVAESLIICLKNQKNNSVKQALKTSRMLCTHFNETSYLDIFDLFSIIQTSIKKFIVSSNAIEAKQKLEQALQEGKSLIQRYVFAHTEGKKLSNAHGISIYFPERMHSSYPPSSFARSNKWFNFISTYLTT
ncbi:MAG TPA: clostripain-related cysteine peptidase [Candidatus Babeliales bacterium]|nr:clostripain-related cysteine peptidase [Candidatus Babeliales bacterium]